MPHNRTGYRASIVALTALVLGLYDASGAAVAAETAPCSNTLAQYDAAIKQLTTWSAKAQAMAAQNPIYESDVQYYAAALADAQRCLRNLSPITTVSR
jgi:hypothetical protein